MTLPQTNLQLYQEMIQHGASASELESVRNAYNISRLLFGDCFRPSHKPFVCHLVGTAGALAMWQQPVPMVVAGMLHSVYLFGRFGDGDRGPTPRRRQWLIQQVGNEAEDLVWRYSSQRWNRPIQEMLELCVDDEGFGEILTLKFADTLDELSDGGPSYSVEKPIVFGLLNERTRNDTLISAVASVVSKQAADQYQSVLSKNDTLAIPSELKTSDRSFHAVETGIDQLRRGKLHQCVNKWARKLRRVA